MDAKGNISEYNANAGFSNTGDKIKFPVDAGLYALSQKYAGLNFLYTDASTPNWVTYDQLAAIDLTLIDKDDLRFDLINGVIKNLAALKNT